MRFVLRHWYRLGLVIAIFAGGWVFAMAYLAGFIAVGMLPSLATAPE